MSTRAFLGLLALVLSLIPTTAHGQPVSVSAHGWTVAVQPDNGTITIEHTGLGPVIENGALGVTRGGKVVPARSWTVERPAPGQMLLKTSEVPEAWLLQLDENTLRFSCNTASAVLSGQMPGGKNRLPVRLLDPRGAPVNWVGTDEVVSSFSGKETLNQSYLPVQNPECMYFSLGPVSNLNFHSVFDRETGTALDFPPETTLVPNQQKADFFDITVPVPGNAQIRVIPDYFTQTLGAPFYIPYDDSRFTTAPTVWCSWTAYYEDVKEKDMTDNADWIAANLKGYGFQYVQLDDGYDRGKQGEHYWIENWDKEKFPHGARWLCDYIKSKGLHPGLWLVPNACAGAVDSHPEWYLHYNNEGLVRDYRTPALDSSNPEVLAFLGKLFQTLRGWGFEYYKFDGEHALPKYVPNVDLGRLYDSRTDPMEIYRKRLAIIREAAGPETFIEGCPAGTPLNGIGYFNSYFAGHDVYNSWQGMYPFFSAINANAFLNHMVVYLMPGEGIDVGPKMTRAEARQKRSPRFVEVIESRESPLTDFGTTLDEARTLVTYSSLTGVTYSLASVLPELPEERVRLLKATLPTLPILPNDLFSRGTDMQWYKFKTTQPDYYIHNYPEILDLKVDGPSGVYDVAAFTNWASKPVTREISLATKLGLPEDGHFVAFDFWRQVLVPVGRDSRGMESVTLEIAPHETRVLLVHPAKSGPQYLGTSRHISGAYSILSARPDPQGRLTGASRTIPREPYSLWFYVDGRPSVTVESNGKPVKFSQKVEARLLTVTFEGQPQDVNWSVGP